jgi:hypothetical protein
VVDHALIAAVAAVVREGSFERAARALFITPSAVSQRVRLLEERIGTVLIVRGQPCVATEVGARLCRHAEFVGMLEAELRRDLPALASADPVPDGGRPTLRVAGNADSLVNELGLTGIQFVNVSNGCATGGSSLMAARSAILSGEFEIGVVAGFDKHDRGAFNADPESMGLGKWYGEAGLMVTTQFFGMKIQRYMHQYGITRSTLAKVAVKNFENGSKNDNAWRRKPMRRRRARPIARASTSTPATAGPASTS